MAASSLTQREQVSEASMSPLLGRAAISELPNVEEDGVPLQSPWTFWVDKPTHSSSVAEYEQAQKKIYTVSTVEGFWRVYNNLPQPSTIGNKYSYHLMRNESKPIWEDPAHMHGGNWKFKCPKVNSNMVWKELLVAAIGEQLSSCVDKEDEIVGVSICVRDRDDVIQVWNTQASQSDKASILNKVQELIPDVHFTTAFYKAFQAHTAFERRK